MGYFNFCNGVSELQMKLLSFLGYFNTFVFTVYVHPTDRTNYNIDKYSYFL